MTLRRFAAPIVTWICLLCIAACRPSAQDLAATYVVQTFEALPPTASITPSATVTPTYTPTGTPLPSPTMFPSITPAPQAVAYAGSEAINLRAGPGVEYEQIGGAAPGEELEVIGRLGDCEWIKVFLNGVGKGWVSRYVVDLRIPCEQIPLLIIATPSKTVVEGAAYPPTGYAPGNHVIRVNNKTGDTLVLSLTGTGAFTFSFPPGNGQRISIPPGNYTISFNACGTTTTYNAILNLNSVFDFKCP